MPQSAVFLCILQWFKKVICKNWKRIPLLSWDSLEVSDFSGALLIGGAGFALLPLNFTTFIDFVRGLGLPWVVYDTLKVIIAFPIAFHSLNGIRFIGFDLAKGTDIASVYRSGYLVLTLAALIALATVVAPRMQHMQHNDYVVVDVPKKKWISNFSLPDNKFCRFTNILRVISLEHFSWGIILCWYCSFCIQIPVFKIFLCICVCRGKFICLENIFERFCFFY